ncbi:MAG TPA: hypothetical protein VK525_14990 [Candidatus Saccharimonadales bacterium]|nr:hypothetical protein [Candidatus Saccharimonadales bacterium]
MTFETVGRDHLFGSVQRGQQAGFGPDILVWLTEQYDRTERKETWTITLEIAVCVLVAAELTFSVLNFLGVHHH